MVGRQILRTSHTELFTELSETKQSFTNRLLSAPLRNKATTLEKIPSYVGLPTALTLCAKLDVTRLFFSNVNVCSYHDVLITYST